LDKTSKTGVFANPAKCPAVRSIRNVSIKFSVPDRTKHNEIEMTSFSFVKIISLDQWWDVLHGKAMAIWKHGTA
jgi:hypothetical protein